MTPRYAAFHIMTSCRNCGQPLPVNGPLRNVECSHCFAQCEIADGKIVDIFESLEKDYPSFADGQGRDVSSMGGAGSFKYSYSRRRPHCAKCQTPLNVDALPSGAQLTQPCFGCGTPWSTFPAPAWLRQLMPQATQCFDADSESAPGGAALAIDQNVPQAIAMACPSCGAGLSVTGDLPRTHPCGYCRTEIFIPDALWKRLHPVKTARYWGVRFEGQAPQQRAAEEKQKQEATRQLQSLAAETMHAAPKQSSWLNELFYIALFTGLLSFLAGMFVQISSDPAMLEQVQSLVCEDGDELRTTRQAFRDRIYGDAVAVSQHCCDEKDNCKPVTDEADLRLYLAAAVPIGLGLTPLIIVSGLVRRRYGYRPVFWGGVVLFVILLSAAMLFW